MKSVILLFVLLSFSVVLFAQNGISFQGIARDVQGNAIPNQTISVKFTIGTFSETQDIPTDDFGVFSATIGSVNTTDFNNLVFANMTDKLKVEVDGATIYDDKFNTVPYAKAAENGAPVGSIMPFAGPKNKLPAGWLYCDGTSYATTGMYGALYTVIGTAWGDDGGKFRVPDLRGYFLRGVDDSQGVDPDASSRTAKYTNGNTGDAVGSFQNDSIKSHAHIIDAGGAHSHSLTNGIYRHWRSFSGDDGSDYVLKTSTQNGGVLWTNGTRSDGSHTHSINNTGGTETRPENANVIFIIKY